MCVCGDVERQHRVDYTEVQYSKSAISTLKEDGSEVV